MGLYHWDTLAREQHEVLGDNQPKTAQEALVMMNSPEFLGRFIYVPVPDPLPNLLNVDEGENSLINLRRLSLIHNVRTYKMEHTLPQTTTDWINTMVHTHTQQGNARVITVFSLTGC